jgi:retinol dehydrogenase-12
MEVWKLDVGDPISVQDFCRRAEKLDRLDAVVENAGIYRENFEREHGHEATINTNVIGTFLLAINLLPILLKSGRKHQSVPRLVIVISEAHIIVTCATSYGSDLKVFCRHHSKSDWKKIFLSH